MSSHITDQETLVTIPRTSTPEPRWRSWVSLGLILLLFLVASLLLFYHLGAPVERDYDEGVYWQSLMAMSSGRQLYQPIFYSQPPLFLLSLYPFFTLLGGTLWAARAGIALFSLLGLLGALLLGKALAGRLGQFVALLLMITSVPFLTEAHVLQADGPSVALSLLAVGLASMWYKQPLGRPGLLWALLTGLTLMFAILVKLLVATSLIPIVLLMLLKFWQLRQPSAASSWRQLLPPSLVGLVACLVVLFLALLPFLGSTFPPLVDGVVTFHNQASAVYRPTRHINLQLIRQAMVTPLSALALAGMTLATLRRDLRVLPLLGWLLATLVLLYLQVPLFPHHLVALIPPLVGLGTLGFGETEMRAFFASLKRKIFASPALPGLIALALLLIVLVFSGLQDAHYLAGLKTSSNIPQRFITDLQTHLTPDQQVITDEQFVASLAGRNTPPELVDTSNVRINTNYLTLSQLIAISSRPQVHAILFYSGRFHAGQLTGYHDWVAQHFHLVRNYGNQQELWVR